MAVSAGKNLGSYEILSHLGSSGMGEVCRAGLLTSLNHPNIAAIYGREESDGIRMIREGGPEAASQINVVLNQFEELCAVTSDEWGGGRQKSYGT